MTVARPSTFHSCTKIDGITGRGAGEQLSPSVSSIEEVQVSQRTKEKEEEEVFYCHTFKESQCQQDTRDVMVLLISWYRDSKGALVPSWTCDVLNDKSSRQKV